MFGFIIGVVTAVVVFKVARRGGFGPWGWRGGGWNRGGHWRGGFWLRWLYRRLNTSPSQEQAIESAAEQLHVFKGRAREELFTLRADLSRAVSGEQLDAALLDRAFARQDELLKAGRAQLVSSLSAIHQVLSPTQRKDLAVLLESGGHWGGGHGHCGYRHGRAYGAA